MITKNFFTRLFAFLLAAFFLSPIFSQDKKAKNEKDGFDEAAAKSVVNAYVKKMSVRQKIGQLCLMNFRVFYDGPQNKFDGGLSPESPKAGSNFRGVQKMNSSIKQAVSQYHVGAVILFAENLQNEEAAKKFVRDLNDAAQEGGNLPLLFCADQEGGNVNRIFDFTMPSAMCIKRCGNLENAFLAGEANGRLLLDYGIHCNFAPVCDIASNRENPVIGIRSFGSDKNYVAQFSNAMQKGIQNAGAIPCAKHFPGHGDTSVDSHLGLPQVNSTFEQWQKNEAVPFEKNIAEGIPMIMTAHIQFPMLDSKKILSSKTKKEIVLPATLSKKILTDILRTQMGFSGVVVTDAMDMKAISDNFSPSESFVLAVNAGADLVCHPINVYSERDMDFLEQFFCEVEAAIESGDLDKEMLEESVARVLLLKAKYGIVKIKNKSVVPAPQKIRAMSEKEKKEAALLAEKIQGIATHFTYKNKIRTKKNVLAFVPYSQKAYLLKRFFSEKKIECEIISYEGKNFVSEELQKKMDEAQTLLIFTQLDGYAVKNKKNWKASFPRAFAQAASNLNKAKSTIAASTNLPYDEEVFSRAKGFGFLATYDYGERGYKTALEEIFPR